MSKNKKKNQKKVQAKIGTTPAKAEVVKKEESVATNKDEALAIRKAAHEKKRPTKEERTRHQEQKYAASKARKEARNARKQTAKDMLNGVKHTKDSTPVKITLEERKKRQEERKKVAYNRHISSIRRRCKRMNLSSVQTDAIVGKAKEQWDKAKSYNIVMICDSFGDKREKLFDIVKKHSIKSACITNCTAFLNTVPKVAVDEIRNTFPSVTIYQYAEKTDLFEAYKNNTECDKKKPKKGGVPHSVECSKSRSINFYNLRRLKKAAKEKMEENTYNSRHGKKAEGRKARRLLRKENAKSVNNKPTQVKEVKEKSNKQAA